ncbi:MAG: hypothetical protein R3B48_25725 [Kofleriaceae bacterium]
MELDHAGYLLRPAASGAAVAAVAQSITVVDAQLARRTALAAHGAVEDVALAPGGRHAAVIDEEGLRLLEVYRDNLRWRVVGKSHACHFDRSGDALWVVRPAAQPSGARLELRDAGNGAVRLRANLEDPFGGSAFTLAPSPDPDGILVWIAAESDTRTVAATIHQGALDIRDLPHHGGYPLEPIPESTDYLLVHEGALERRAWADHAVADALDWPWIQEEDLAVLPLSSRYALWASRSGRLHLVDAVDMAYVEEVGVEGRRPAPLREYVPASEDSRWGTDLQQFCVSGDHVILQYGDTTLASVAISELLP